MTEEATQIVAPIVQGLEAAWNAGSGARFGAAFADDADFVDIRAEYHSGKQSISFGHQAIMDTIYKGSVNKYSLVNARHITPDVIVAQVSAELQVPAGPLAGRNQSMFTIVLRRDGDAWAIVALQNTLVPPSMNPEEEKVREAIR